MKIYIYILLLIASIFSQNEREEDLNVYFDLYNQIFEKFTSNYVDTLDKTQLIKGSLDGMFSSVDPYTKLYIGFIISSNIRIRSNT